MTIGSLARDVSGTVRLPNQQLTVGGNGQNTTFSGLISQGGSLVKTGSDRLTLSGADTYGGGTTVTGGPLIFPARTDSATAADQYRSTPAPLAGKGAISGAFTVGTGTGAFLAPGVKRPDTLTMSKLVTFKADEIYQCDLSLGQAKADQVTANGVIIDSGARFVFLPKGFQTLAPGTVFTVINTPRLRRSAALSPTWPMVPPSRPRRGTNCRSATKVATARSHPHSRALIGASRRADRRPGERRKAFMKRWLPVP